MSKKQKITEGNLRRPKMKAITPKQMRTIVFVLWIALVLTTVNIYCMVDSLKSKGEVTLFADLSSVENKEIYVLVTALVVIAMTLISVRISKVKETCELMGRIEEMYHSALDQLLKTTKIIQIIKEYRYKGELPEPERKVYGLTKDVGSVEENVITIKAVIKKENAEIAGMVLVEFALSVTAVLIKFSSFGIEGTLVEVALYVAVVVYGIFAIADSVERNKKNKFLLTIAECLEESEKGKA